MEMTSEEQVLHSRYLKRQLIGRNKRMAKKVKENPSEYGDFNVIAYLFQVKLDTARMWQKRDKDFPKPFVYGKLGSSAGHVFKLSEVEEWRKTKLSKNPTHHKNREYL